MHTDCRATIEQMGRILRLVISMLIALIILCAQGVSAHATTDGAAVFDRHCVGCHVNGGNIIRRGKSLKMAALERNGVDSPEAIAAIARAGIGRMSGYGNVLEDGDDQRVANWIWQQAQKAWIQG